MNLIFQTMIKDFKITDDQLTKIAAAMEERYTNNSEIQIQAPQDFQLGKYQSFHPVKRHTEPLKIC